VLIVLYVPWCTAHGIVLKRMAQGGETVARGGKDV
jgi:hypothetical protein